MAAQFLTAMAWGRVADSRRAGRKTVLLIGLLGTSLSCLGFGFSTTFWQALVFRTLGGSTNGNIGVMRTMYMRPPEPICLSGVLTQKKESVLTELVGFQKSSGKGDSKPALSSSSP
jgi:MFS family permease